MTYLTITIPLPPKGCRPNGSHGHYRKKSAAKKVYREQAWAAARAAIISQAGYVFSTAEGQAIAATAALKKGPPRWRKARVAVICYTKTATRMDPDNLVASLKSAFDGLADAGVIANDKELWPDRPQFFKDAQNPRIELTITEEA